MRTVPHVDLERYMGNWYVIAEIPYFAERNCVDSVESYALRPDGDIDNTFSCRRKSFDAPMKRVTSARAHVLDPTSNAAWRVRFFGVLSAQYRILELDPDYQWVLIGHPSRHYAWILARSRTLSDATYDEILRRARTHGFDPAQFSRVPQNPAATAGAGTG